MVEIPKNPLILIDCSSYLYRAYYAFPSLTNRFGEPTNSIYGVLNMLRSFLLKYQPTHAAVVFDAPEKTFRDKLFKQYKSHRPSMPKNLLVQIKPLHAMIQAMGLPLVIVSGVEADDVIGTIARNAEEMGREVLISSGDKDMVQLVTSKISLINTRTNDVFGPKEVIIKYSIPPKLIIDLLALTGDRSDNIPGIPGIGKKTALSLLQIIGGIDAIYQQIDKIKQLSFRGATTVVSKLEKYKKIAYLSYQLATIKTNIELNLNYEQLKIQETIVDKLLYFCEKYDFHRWVAYIKKNGSLLV